MKSQINLEEDEIDVLLVLVQVEQQTFKKYEFKEKELEMTQQKYIEGLKSIESKLLRTIEQS